MERWIGWKVALGGLFFGIIGLSEVWGAGSRVLGWGAGLASAAVGQIRAVPPRPVAVDKKEEADPQEENKDNQESEGGMDVFVPPPREVLKNLFATQQLLEQGRWSEAVGFLQTILTAPEDYFFQPEHSRQTRLSLKNEAQRLLGQMPEEARQMYEIRYGPQARQLLRQAVAEGNPEKLSEISRTFYHTEAGYEATLLLGLHHLRSGRVLAAALLLDRLGKTCPNPQRFEPTLSLALAAAWYRAREPEQAKAVLVRLKSAQGGKPLRIGGQQTPWFSRESDCLTWLAQWVDRPSEGGGVPGPEDAGYWMVRNNPARNGETSGGRPLLNLRWRVPTADHPLLEQWLRQFHQDLEAQGIPCLAQGIPLVVGDTVLMRSVQNLVAVDIHSGKRVWESPVAAPIDTILAGQNPQMALGQATALQLRMAQRVWLDSTYSRLSSDGRYVFCIEEDSVWERPMPGGMPPILIIRQRMKEGRRSTTGNRLVAYDIRTGKLQWELGGPEDQEYTLPLAGTAFLGPPLPLMGHLYVLGESGNDIRLWVLEAQTGRLVWSQQLGVIGQDGGPNFDFDGQPTNTCFLGLSPSYAEGILVCPTGQGALVAMDLASRTFLWAYAYLSDMEARDRRRMQLQQMAGFLGGSMGAVPTDGWMETTCLLAEGRVLFTTPETREIYCLNLTDGKELWKQTCSDGVYLACVHEGKVVWVGRRRVGAFRLADGQLAWQSAEVGSSTGAIDLPEGTTPSGIGFRSGGKYYLPLSNGEVATLDLTKGVILHRTRSRTEASPGNLICVRDKVISQSPEGVELYEQLESLRVRTEAQLAQNPQDPEALAIWGEILLDQGQRAEAIQAFQRSLALQADLRTRQFLREAMFEGLQEDFNASRHYMKELEKLLDSPEDRIRYERLVASGLVQVGEYTSAWEMALRLAERKEQLSRLEQLSPSYALRGDCWLRDHLEQLRSKASAELQKQIDRQIQEQLEKAKHSEDPIRELTAFLNLHENHPVAEQARQELLSRLVSGGRWLEAEMLLRKQAQCADPAKQRLAVAQLAELLRRAGRPAEAAVYYRQLADQWADLPCQEGKTGRQIVQSLPPEDPVHRTLQPIQWPQGRVEVQKTPLGGSSSNQEVAQRVLSHGRFFLSRENVSEPIYSDIQIVFDQNRRMLLAYDRFGRELWKPFALSPGDPRTQFFGFNRSWWRVYLQGHLLVLSTGIHLQAYDLIGNSGGDGPRLLWSHDLLDPARFNGAQGEIVLAVMPGMGWRQVPGQRGMAAIGSVSDRVVCFQRLRQLTGVDALTGQTLWVRNDLPTGCELFGDEERLFVIPPDDSEVLVLQPWDGKLVGKRSLPKLNLAPPLPAGVGMPGGQPPVLAPGGVQTALPVGFLRQYRLTSVGGRLLLWHPESNKQVLRWYDLWEQKDVWGPMRFEENTRTSLIEKEAVGLLEPNGQFTLIRIADGRVLVKDQLDLGQMALQGIHLLRLDDQYYVIPYGIPSGFQHMPQQPPPGMHVAQVPAGRVYAYTKEGKRLWPDPVELRHQNVLLGQPAGLPVLVFATQLFERRNQGGGTFHVHLLAIHKQTGRKILEEKFPYTTNVFQIIGDPEKHTVEILLQRDKLTLTFTDQPWPTETSSGSSQPDQKTPAKKPTTLREGMWRGIRKLLLPEKNDEGGWIPFDDPVPPLPVPVPDTQ